MRIEHSRHYIWEKKGMEKKRPAKSKRVAAPTRVAKAAKKSAQDRASVNLTEELIAHQEELEAQNLELRAALQNLNKSQQLYSDLYDSAPCGYITCDRNGVVVGANLTMASMLKVSRESVVGRQICDFAANQFESD